MSQILRIEFYRNDPLMRLLRNRLRLNWWRVMVAWALLWIADSPLYAYVAGVYWSSPRVIGFVQDLLPQLSMTLWTGAVMSAYYVWCGGSFTSLMWRLVQSGSLCTVSHWDSHGEQKSYLWATEKLEELWNRPLWIVGPFAIAGAWMLFVYFPMISAWPDMWWSVYPAYLAWNLLKMLLATYVVMRIVVMEALGVYSLHQLVKYRVLSFQPFHPDNAGGLLPIGQYRIKLVYALAGASVFLLFVALRGVLTSFTLPGAVVGSLNIGDVAIYLVFIVVVPISFFLPIWKIHSFMKLGKSRIIDPVSKAKEFKLRELNQSSLNSGVPAEELSDLFSVTETLENIPEWPYDTSVFRRFIGSWISIVLSPFVGFLIDLLLQNLI